MATQQPQTQFVAELADTSAVVGAHAHTKPAAVKKRYSIEIAERKENDPAVLINVSAALGGVHGCG